MRQRSSRGKEEAVREDPRGAPPVRARDEHQELQPRGKLVLTARPGPARTVRPVLLW